MVVEVGLLLDRPQEYYEAILQQHGARLMFACQTHDVYWSKHQFINMTEAQIKSACVRYRSVTRQGDVKEHTSLQNDEIVNTAFGGKQPSIKNYTLPELERFFSDIGWRKVFDTTKTDYQFKIGNMKSCLQLQNIEGVGLLLYYDNPDLYYLPETEQRKALIDELNTYGFYFAYNTPGVDKLRSLHTGKLCFSMNQADNGDFIN